MYKDLLVFLSLFVGIIVFSYVVHIGIIDSFSINRNRSIIDLSYTFNGIFTVVHTSLIILLQKSFKNQLGFIFLAGSFLKIGLFITYIKINDMEMSKSVFADFFIPYAICLIVEVYYISKMLNNIK